MEAVGLKDVRDAPGTVEEPSGGRPERRMGCAVLGPEVGFGLDDPSRGEGAAEPGNQDAAEQTPGDPGGRGARRSGGVRRARCCRAAGYSRLVKRLELTEPVGHLQARAPRRRRLRVVRASVSCASLLVQGRELQATPGRERSHSKLRREKERLTIGADRRPIVRRPRRARTSPVSRHAYPRLPRSPCSSASVRACVAISAARSGWPAMSSVSPSQTSRNGWCAWRFKALA